MSTVLITGANRGLGLEFTKQYLKDGWKVFACCRNPFNAKELNELTKQFPDQLAIEGLDVSNHRLIDSLANDLNGTPIEIDVLINNSGVMGDKQNFGEIDYCEWEEVLRINTFAPVKITEALIKNLEKGKQKKVINITSKMGSISDNTSGGHYLYRSSKVALNMVTKSLSVDLKNKNITVVAIHPGWVVTDMGGPNALINANKSVSSIKDLINKLSLEDSGKFLSYDGKEIEW
ncbi:MAG: SDR family oxidoreductase [Candidatus Caenarcaniphilales bacterium]|nr:SDR family oxidoreductase [Candidatus Caenarcaniphilales bacterium]